MVQKDLYVLNSDMTGGPFIEINKRFPERYVQVGIAEQNMIAVACGLALAGKTPITYSPSPFVFLRAFDQIRNAIGSMSLKVVMVANGQGFVNPSFGSTHFPTECYNMISLCPNIEYCAVSDEPMAYSLSDYIINDLKQSMFVTIDFLCDGTIKSDESVDMSNGWRYIRNCTEKNTLIISHGYLTRVAIENEYKTKTSIIEIFKSPYDRSALIDELRKYKKIIVAEEYQLRGGLGSEISSLVINNNIKSSVKCLGINYGDKFPDVVGTREYFMSKFGVDKEKLLVAVDG